MFFELQGPGSDKRLHCDRDSLVLRSISFKFRFQILIFKKVMMTNVFVTQCSANACNAIACKIQTLVSKYTFLLSRDRLLATVALTVQLRSSFISFRCSFRSGIFKNCGMMIIFLPQIGCFQLFLIMIAILYIFWYLKERRVLRTLPRSLRAGRPKFRILPSGSEIVYWCFCISCKCK